MITVQNPPNPTLRVISDESAARDAWRFFYGESDELFHRWEVRDFFYREFQPRLHFIITENPERSAAFMPLVYSAETASYQFFPGELWQRKTWIEQNKIFADTAGTAAAMLNSLDAPPHLRYLQGESLPPEFAKNFAEDEINYRFYPAEYGFDFSAYWQSFSGKTRAKFAKELNALTAAGASFRYNHHEDLQWLIAHNLENFAENSYFTDERFSRAFQNLAAYFAREKMLRLTTALIGGEIAAVDIGVLSGGKYTVIAGSVDRKFRGVAKLINFEHLKFACAERLKSADFLCGDFGWKERFHFRGQPLYKLTGGV